ncbi:hypothetical protein KJ784_01355 [Patescibacteria group bacterium]|nr:hypothetical protein [Patescibacteria group bacterium]
MNIKKCDICKKVMKDREGIKIYPQSEIFASFEICDKCGVPVMRFLKNKKLIKDKK